MATHSEAFLRLANEAKTRIKEVTPLEANEIVKQGAVLLDVREKDEFEQNHLPGAKHLGRGILEMKVDEIVPGGRCSSP
jgi:phage shock protein E